ncbi:hypothetical protein H7992_09545 [Sporosarcina sp. resist]|uniref:hypothetical protein n=1 Tax=Sporosarcina sp. resist TaxID=2762563 RepID=UPI00164E4C85|nr:hypothetical protein [Sporosarcina sp. resist]QNK89862.1 hypothetical protein H7992_09545 [Sporosarcina sp. resist]
MPIEQYLDQLEGQNKRHVLLIITPKGEYPTQFSRKKYHNLEDSILENPKSYIGFYEEDVPEIMQFTAFRLFLKPLICDNERIYDRSISKVRRLKKDGIVSFVVAKHFYNTVPYGEKTEENAINEGLSRAEDFLRKYPIEEFEFASVELGKDSDEANIFIKLDLKHDNDDYYFDFVYVH